MIYHLKYHFRKWVKHLAEVKSVITIGVLYIILLKGKNEYNFSFLNPFFKISDKVVVFINNYLKCVLN